MENIVRLTKELRCIATLEEANENKRKELKAAIDNEMKPATDELAKRKKAIMAELMNNQTFRDNKFKGVSLRKGATRIKYDIEALDREYLIIEEVKKPNKELIDTIMEQGIEINGVSYEQGAETIAIDKITNDNNELDIETAKAFLEA